MALPSLRFKVESIQGELHAGRVEYIMGRNTRTEYDPLHAVIRNHDLQRHFHLDLGAGVYTVCRIDGGRRTGMRAQPSGRTLHIHTKTVDTGERREMFGRTARRVLTSVTQTYELEGGSGPAITEVDGRYIDAPAAWLAAHPPFRGHSVLLAVSDGRLDTPVFTDDGPRETGFPLLVSRTYRSSYTDAQGIVRVHTSENREEVTELSEENLESDLFVPPPHFRRVRRLPGETRVPFNIRARARWQWFRNALLGRR